MDLHAYEWIVGLGGLLAVTTAYGIGANDVANAFASSVGSGALSIKTAVILAGIFEFSGALLMGSHVTDTIRKGIADYSCFEDDPAILMYGCMCVLAAMSVWLVTASYLEMPVSTTHSCVGGMIGMTMVSRGVNCVTWTKETDKFPYIKGVSAIVVSWLLSPIVSGIFASFFFYILRLSVLRSENSFTRSKYAFPILLGSTVCINVFFIVYKGAKFLKLNETPIETAFAYAFGLGCGVGLLSLTIVPYLHKLAEQTFIDEMKDNENHEIEISDDKCEPCCPPDNTKLHMRIYNFIKNSLNVDRREIIEGDETVMNIHENAEKFDDRTEISMRYLQIITACCDAFAHGANDVANSIAPFGAIWAIYESGEVSKKKNDLGDNAYWILSLGAFGIVIGLATYGYKILHAIGTKLTKITPSRGTCIELGSACVIIMGSRLGWPLSTTHCQVGATVGVGLLEGKKGINYKILRKTVLGWIVTLVVVGGGTALLFAQGAYAPMARYPMYVKNMN
mgnify:FL=1